MEPLPGITAFAAVFDRASGARLEAAERFVRSLPRLFPDALVGCDLAWRPGANILVVIMRLAERRFGAGARRRLDFWCGRAGVRSTEIGKLAVAQRTAFFDRIERCEPKLMGVAPDELAAESGRLFTELGAPEGRKQADSAPVLAMDVGGPGWEGVDYVPVERTLFVPGLLSPPAGDELTLALRFPGIDRPLQSEATVVGVRGGDGETPRSPPGFALALTNPPLELLQALASLDGPVETERGEQRAHPRYSVKAPVLVTPYVAPPPGGDAKEEPVEVSFDDEPAVPAAPFPMARIEYATEQELAADYVANLSQGGAFVRTSRPSPLGTRLALSMRLPGGDELAAPAVVAMVNDKGMGVKFELDESAQQRLAAAIARISARPRRALVVDDDALARRMLQDALEQRGFEVLTADDGAAGLSVLADELLALDLLVTDVVMPNMDGESLIRTIRNAGGESDLAIVAVTGEHDGETEKRLERDGADAVLDKALGAELIAQAADAVLERKRMGREG
jgi:uncharacterized protein (TIGR02266 family)